MKFSLVGITIDQFALFEDNYRASGALKMGIGFEFSRELEKNHISVFSKVTILCDSDLALTLKVKTKFEIEKSDWASIHSDSGILLPADFARHLAMVNIGTTRGILFSKTEGTLLASYLLPTINIKDFILGDIKI